jgi:hypothetical protein
MGAWRVDMTSSSDASGLLSRGEWRGGGCWREIAPWCIVGIVPTASLEVLSVVRHLLPQFFIMYLGFQENVNKDIGT